ncbi:MULTISPECIES: hypothetical protein [unclassified Ornithinimicrobium]|uniref:hypothetical protein n=1 Tax=unclassified Ornithinimicrobium TaxID=2615080 RepID=UPI003854E117
MSSTAAAVATVVLGALAALQVLVAAGRPHGRLVWGGQHPVLPGRLRVASLLSVLLYAVFAAVLLARAGIVTGGDDRLVVVATWVLLGYFVLGTGVNAVSRSTLERRTMTPVCAVLALATLVVALDL